MEKLVLRRINRTGEEMVLRLADLLTTVRRIGSRAPGEHESSHDPEPTELRHGSTSQCLLLSRGTSLQSADRPRDPAFHGFFRVIPARSQGTGDPRPGHSSTT